MARIDINDQIRALLKGQPGVLHEKLECKLVDSHYHGSTVRQGGQWKDKYVCPECNRTCQVLANYLGQRKVICDGIKFTKEAKT